MGILYIILLLFIELYTAAIVIYFFVQFSRKKKFPRILMIAEAICIAVFLYLKFMIRQRQLVFIGGHEDVLEDETYGFGNMMSFVINQGILVILFLVTQVIFWYLYLRARNKVPINEIQIPL
jgi:hypothetical protein